MIDAISKLLNVVKKSGLYPEIVDVRMDNDKDPVFNIDGHELLTFNSCNYLGLSNHPQIRKVVADSVLKYGIHPSNSTLVGGLWDIHREFERHLAQFFNYDDSMLFTTTTAVNMGVIPAISNLPIGQFLFLMKLYTGSTETTIFSDELNHATIVDACRIAKAPIEIYKHMDLEDLENRLKKCPTKRKIIVTDGVFSMDGHIIDLPRIIKIKDKHRCLLVVDDAHSIGVLGRNGKGIQDHFGIERGIDFYIASLSKGFGITGGCVCATKEYIDYLRVTARTYIFSRTFLAPLAEGGIKVLEILESDDGQERISKLWENTTYLTDNLGKLGFDTLGTKTPIVPILIGEEKRAIKLSGDLLENGIYVPAMRWPAVSKGTARLRIMVTSLHQKEHLDLLLGLLEKYGKKHNIFE
jgi:8-amino-7-oxononanoate synthase